ncbi:MAG: nitrophenyl compound nitroreductase subunit ArsF family protein [Thermodesulfovibrionales bacterium]
MNIRKLIKILLFVFVALSFAVLIYKGFSPKRENYSADTSATNNETSATDNKSVLAGEMQSIKESESKQRNIVPSSKTEVKNTNAKVIAYYFHGTFRCNTCRTIEKYSKEAIERYFTQELNNNTLEFKPINVEEPENRHYIQDYQLFTRSLVLVRYKDNKQQGWKNLTEVWAYVRDKERFYQYVKDEVEKFLKDTL